MRSGAEGLARAGLVTLSDDRRVLIARISRWRDLFLLEAPGWHWRCEGQYESTVDLRNQGARLAGRLWCEGDYVSFIEPRCSESRRNAGTTNATIARGWPRCASTHERCARGAGSMYDR